MNSTSLVDPGLLKQLSRVPQHTTGGVLDVCTCDGFPQIRPVTIAFLARRMGIATELLSEPN